MLAAFHDRPELLHLRGQRVPLLLGVLLLERLERLLPGGVRAGVERPVHDDLRTGRIADVRDAFVSAGATYEGIAGFVW